MTTPLRNRIGANAIPVSCRSRANHESDAVEALDSTSCSEHPLRFHTRVLQFGVRAPNLEFAVAVDLVS